MCVAEATYLIHRDLGVSAEAAFLRGLEELEVVAPQPEDWRRIADLVEQYRDLRIGGTDASVVALAERLDQVAAWIGTAFGLPSEATFEAKAQRLAEWSRENGLPTLSALGVDADARELAAEAAASSSSMKANPAILPARDLERIMEAAG